MHKSRMPIIFLGILCILGFILRFYLLPSHLFFGPEQGRDMLVVRDIVVNHKLTLIGSKTDVDGIFHGPIFYYLATIPFILSRGDPLFISIFFLLFQVASIPLIYLLVVEFTEEKRPALIAATLFTVSFQAIVYARWLSNPPLSIPFVILLFFFLVRYLKGDTKSLIGAGIAYGCLGQAEFINYALFGVLVIVIAIRYIPIIKKTPVHVLALSMCAVLIVSFGTYVLFDIRHGFLITRVVLGLISGGVHQSSFLSTSREMLKMYLTESAAVFGLYSLVWGVLVICVVLYGWFGNRRSLPYAGLILFWIFIPVICLSIIGHGALSQLFVGLIPAWVIGMAIGIDTVWRKSVVIGIFLLACIVVVSLESYISNIPNNERVFFQTSQARLRYTDELAVVHAIYSHANGRPFYFQAFTIPVFWQDGWTYLFWYEGTTKYHYLPIERDKSIIYVIIPTIHDDPFLALFQKNWYRDTVSTWGTKTYSETIGEFQVEERQKI